MQEQLLVKTTINCINVRFAHCFLIRTTTIEHRLASSNAKDILKYLRSVLVSYVIFLSAFKPKFAASEKIKEISKDYVMVNVEVS